MDMTGMAKCRHMLSLLLDPACLAGIEMGLLLLSSIFATIRQRHRNDCEKQAVTWNPSLEQEASRLEDGLLYYRA